MPYRRVGKVVEVQKGGKWQHKTTHPTEAAAQAHLIALRINVPHGGSK